MLASQPGFGCGREAGAARDGRSAAVIGRLIAKKSRTLSTPIEEEPLRTAKAAREYLREGGGARLSLIQGSQRAGAATFAVCGAKTKPVEDSRRQVDAELFGAGAPSIGASPQDYRDGL